LPGVKGASVSGDLPTTGSGILNQRGWFRDASLDVKRVKVMTSIEVDENYVPVLNIQLVTGRNFSRIYGSDSAGIILNETAAKILGLTDPLNTKLYWPGDDNKPVVFHVIGVVHDFNFSTMHEKIGPLVMRWANSPASIAVRFDAKDVSALISGIGIKWQAMTTGLPLSYTFMDNDFNNMYFADLRTGKLFTTFAVFAIFIACLGLFGLINYAAQQRIRRSAFVKCWARV
jgi:putative ABC transport system permease protein